MGAYQLGGDIQTSARYVGEFVPSDDLVQYFYLVMAYDANSLPLTTAGNNPFAWGPQVLDGNHAISVQWAPIIAAHHYKVYKNENAPAVEDISNPFWEATGSETGVLDTGYPATTRNSFLNPGLSPIFAAGCCGDAASVATNVPPAGMAPPADTFPAGGYVRVAGTVPVITLNPTVPAGNQGDIQFNDAGRFGADPDLFWDNVAKRLGIHTRVPTQALDVNG